MSLDTNLKNLVTRTATEFKTVKNILSGNNSGALSSLSTSNKDSLLAAINEVKTLADNSANSGGLNATQVDNAITAQINSLLDSAPAALNTLNELAASIGDDANFSGTMTTALGNRVRIDTASQGLNATQKANARTNIGAVSVDAIGPTNTNYVALFNSALT